MSVTINRINQTKRGRFALFDETGEFLFSLDEETMVKNKVCEGVVFTLPQLNDLKCDSDTRRAKDQALRYLSRRMYGEEELYKKVCLKYDEYSASAAVAAMCELGLLDDETFAQAKAAALAAQGKSSREICRRLRELGLAKDSVDCAMQDLCVDDEAAALAIVQKSYMHKLQAGQQRNVMAALARRGFTHGVICAVLEMVGDEDACEDEEFAQE